MFAPEDILYEDNHLLIVNKRCGDLVHKNTLSIINSVIIIPTAIQKNINPSSLHIYILP